MNDGTELPVERLLATVSEFEKLVARCNKTVQARSSLYSGRTMD